MARLLFQDSTKLLKSLTQTDTPCDACRTRFWFWDSIVLIQTLALAASQVFATSLNSYFQLTIMLMVLVIGITVLAHYQPFEDALSQSMQVCDGLTGLLDFTEAPVAMPDSINILFVDLKWRFLIIKLSLSSS